MYKDYSHLIQKQINDINAHNVHLSSPVKQALAFANSPIYKSVIPTIDSIMPQIRPVLNFYNSNPVLMNNLKTINNALPKNFPFENAFYSNPAKVASRINAKQLIQINKMIENYQNQFKSSLFSNSVLERIKRSIDMNINSYLIDNSFKILRYEYVKNTLFYNNSIRQIKWEPVITNSFNTFKEFGEIRDDVINTSENGKLQNAIDSMFKGWLLSHIGEEIDELTNHYITFLANVLLPFIPHEYRAICFYVIIFIVSYNKSNR
ncbi:hypothetical protein PYO30_02205 [Staphylococcus epidermidis]|uniref:hypothetical protein n=1 Tax=Staphylococcus epidermidis TaxID=1282 RepID=UPI0011A5F782|nr:hypothetical protein [Staphylococcus epidermidis]MBM0826847.1 hypothetical protein [Staphylococcus epidermidis]MDH8771395.1 hypothetical protein [Staphylococcus epidermidis]MDH8774264.1 hypothetical protein [Staphylococcus epidermidis]MDH8816745.1 hypothetical protein [Staphylococcus epidermidis]MDH8861889.1 hypothetical protein [Staphylococcus epidermidis]